MSDTFLAWDGKDWVSIPHPVQGPFGIKGCGFCDRWFARVRSYARHYFREHMKV